MSLARALCLAVCWRVAGTLESSTPTGLILTQPVISAVILADVGTLCSAGVRHQLVGFGGGSLTHNKGCSREVEVGRGEQERRLRGGGFTVSHGRVSVCLFNTLCLYLS